MPTATALVLSLTACLAPTGAGGFAPARTPAASVPLEFEFRPTLRLVGARASALDAPPARDGATVADDCDEQDESATPSRPASAVPT